MNLLRKVKISEILNQPLVGIDAEIVDFIDSKINFSVPFKHPDFPNDTILLDKNKNWVFKYQMIPSGVYVASVRFSNFWEILLEKYEMGLTDSTQIIQYKIEKYLGIKFANTMPVDIQGLSYNEIPNESCEENKYRNKKWKLRK